MTKPHLRACPSCARHVRVSEQACPFCAAPLDSAFRAAPAPLPPALRLTRAALFAFGTGTLIVPVAACNSSSTPAPDFAADAAYGAAPGEEDSAPPATDAGDASAPATDAGSPADAGSPDASSLLDAAYGGFPIDP